MRRKKKKIDLKYKIIIGMLIGILVIILLSFSFKYNYISRIINSIFYYPFNYIETSNTISDGVNSELESEINSLKELLNLDEVMSDMEVVNGVIISRDISSFNSEVIVNKGSSDKIEEGMAVVNNYGIVGYVKEVYQNSSRVTLITNPTDNKTSVRINDDYYVLEFDSDGNMIVNVLDNNTDIKEKDTIYTSGLTDKYPSGIIVGYVGEIKDNSMKTGKVLSVSLGYDINNIRYVAIVKRTVE